MQSKSFTAANTVVVKLFTVLLIYSTGCVQPDITTVNAEGNKQPVINSITAEPLSIKVGSTAAITVQASDPDGDPLSFSWTVALGDIIGSGNEVIYTAAFCCVGINTIYVTVEDGRGGTSTASVNIEVFN
ncbi:MAG: hypothetical protein Kow0098_02740 [Ignavibacteriaceae bacterium]